MAGNIKQKMLKAGRDYNYAEGVKVKADAQIYADQIVYVTGNDGPYLTVNAADADATNGANGRLLIAKHDIPAAGYGVCLPWKLVTTFSTAVPEVGDPVYLSDSVTAGVAGNLSFTAPSDAKTVIVGRVTKKGTVAAGAGILVNAASPELRVLGGSLPVAQESTFVEGRPTEVISWVMNDGDSTITLGYPVVVVDAWAVQGGATAITEIKLYKGNIDAANDFAWFITDGAAELGSVLRPQNILYDNLAFAKGNTMRAVKTDGNATDRIYVTVIRA